MIFFIGVLHGILFAILLSNLFYLRRRTAKEAMAALPRISVLIPARNEEENLNRLLPSLFSQDYPDFEVIVYDDASEDGTALVLAACQDFRLCVLKGNGPPPGWVGKVNALYQATRPADGDLYFFLDADTQLLHPGALRSLVQRFLAMPENAVMTGLPRFRGGGLLLVSLVPGAILGQLPWLLVRRTRSPSLSALNGQCWMIGADVYHAHEPHLHVKNEILEDVQIGRYLKSRGHFPTLLDVQEDLVVWMYGSFGEAWRGFRKNAYLLSGGRLLPFLAFLALYVLAFVLAPIFSLVFLASLYLLKGVVDRRTGFPLWVTALVPLSYALGALLQLDSAVSHLRRRVAWKGRNVGA